MAFSAEICITNTGNTQLGPVLYAYSDLDFYATPFNTNLLTANLIGNCPYVLDDIPDGTLIVLLKDISNGCCVYISLEPTINLCTICDLGFDVYSTNTVSVVTAGNLTGSCENNITDYVVNWYGPNSDTDIQFTSGEGDYFIYDWIHPLTGNSAVFAPGGTYNPRIESIYLNGVEFQEDLGALSACFEPITVESFNCSNGTSPVASYSHLLTFSNASQGVTPPNLTSEFILSSTTNYFAYAFRTEQISDSLKITYSGSSYDTPLVIEYITTGQDLNSTNFGADVFPKSADTVNWFTKVLCLTGLTYVNGDKLIIEVEPNPTNPVTDWSLYFSCLETFDCEKCIDTNTPYKIILSSITATTGTCNTVNISYKVSGCSIVDNNNDVYNYMIGDGTDDLAFGRDEGTSLSPQGQQVSFDLYYSSITCSLVSYYAETFACYSDNNYQIYYRSWRPDVNTRLIQIKFENFDDFNAYASTFYAAMVYSGSTDPQSVEYYKRLKLAIPNIDTSSVCGDNTTYKDMTLHPSTVQFITGTTSEFPFAYTINITSTTISDQINFDSCFLGCNSLVDEAIVEDINQTITSPFFDFTGTSLTSYRVTIPFYQLTEILIQQETVDYGIFQGRLYFPEYSNITYVASGNPLVNVSELSAQTCDFTSTMKKRNVFGYQLLEQYAFYYKLELTNPLEVEDFRIYASPITNGGYNGYPGAVNFSDLVYGYSGGAPYFTNSSYLIF